MKIAIIRQRYNPYGGAERFVERALGALASEGAAVTLITRSWDGAPRAGFAHGGAGDGQHRSAERVQSGAAHRRAPPSVSAAGASRTAVLIPISSNRPN